MDIERRRATIRTHTYSLSLPPRRRVAYLYITPSPGFGHGHRIIAPSFPVPACACHHFESPIYDRYYPPPLAHSPSRDCGQEPDSRPPSNSLTNPRTSRLATIRERPRCIGLQIDARMVLDNVHAHKSCGDFSASFQGHLLIKSHFCRSSMANQSMEVPTLPITIPKM